MGDGQTTLKESPIKSLVVTTHQAELWSPLRVFCFVGTRVGPAFSEHGQSEFLDTYSYLHNANQP